MRRVFGAAIFFLVVGLMAKCSFAQDVLSIKIPGSVKISANSFALSQVAEISGSQSAVRTAGWIRFSADGKQQLTRDEVVNALQNSELAGVKIELRMPQFVKINKNSSELANPPRIKKGSTVMISTNINGIVVSAQGEAMQDGKAGDTIKVRNIASKKIVSAIVINSEQVEVRI